MDSLIKKAKEGDRQALATLIDNHKNIAYSLALRITKDNEEAKDITQQSFLIVLESINKFRDQAKFSTWLYKIVYHEAIRSVKRKHLPIEEELVNSLANESADHLEQKEIKYQLNAAIERLSENERVVILLFYMAEKPIKEINLITGFTKSNIKVLLHRGRKQLKALLEYEYHEK